jgi:hypothetical protein
MADKKKFRIITQTGLLVGALDGLAAALLYFIRSGKNPLAVYRYIASGVVGPEALAGGMVMGLLGILFHFVIAMGWTILFFVASAQLPFLSKHWLLSGVGYGIFVWLMMNLLVIPISRVPSSPITWSSVTMGMSVLILCIGIPISFMARRSWIK